MQAINVAEPRNGWHYYEISRVVARVVSHRRSARATHGEGHALQCGRNTQILQQSDMLIQRALEIEPNNAEYLIEGGYQALMANNIRDAMKFYKAASKAEAENTAAVYGSFSRLLAVESGEKIAWLCLGFIHCQILDGKYADAKQQIEFQNEVQTGNPAVSDEAFVLHRS